jgi:hypothetical protein
MAEKLITKPYQVQTTDFQRVKLLSIQSLTVERRKKTLLVINLLPFILKAYCHLFLYCLGGLSKANILKLGIYYF